MTTASQLVGRKGRAMIRFSLFLAVIAAVALALACNDGGSKPLAPKATAVPGAEFSGSASIDGEALSDRAIIVAQIDGQNCGSGFVLDGSYELTVRSFVGCGTQGARVTFVLGIEGGPGGTEADQSGTWDNTQVNELDITFTTVLRPTATQQ